MMTIRSIKNEIKELQKDLARNGFEISMNKNNAVRLIELLHCRQEIYKSICHRQFLIMELMDNEIRFNQAV
jgi:hypothetical protein